MSLASLAAASMPPRQLLAALKACKAPRAGSGGLQSQPHMPAHPEAGRRNKQPAARLQSLGFALEDWRIAYSTRCDSIPQDSVPRGAQGSRAGGAHLPFREVLTIGSMGAEVQVAQRSITAVLSDLAVSYLESAAPDSSGCSSPSSSAAHAAGQSARAAQAQAPLDASPSTPAASKPAPTPAPAPQVEMVHLSTVTVGILPPAPQFIHICGDASQPAAVPSVHLDLRGVAVKFEPDVAFAAVDIAAEVTAVAAHFSESAALRAADAADDAADALAAAVELPGHAAGVAASAAVHSTVSQAEPDVAADEQQKPPPHGGIAPEHPFGAQLRRLGKPRKVELAVHVRDISADLALVEGVRIEAEVSAPLLRSRLLQLLPYPKPYEQSLAALRAPGAICPNGNRRCPQSRCPLACHAHIMLRRTVFARVARVSRLCGILPSQGCFRKSSTNLQVESLCHKLGTLAAELSAVSVKLNGMPVAKAFEACVQLDVLAPSQIAPGGAGPTEPECVGSGPTAVPTRGAVPDTGLLMDVELPEDSDSVQLGWDGDTPQQTPEAATALPLGARPEGAMPFSGDPVELRRARQRAGIPEEDTPAVMVRKEHRQQSSCKVLEGK